MAHGWITAPVAGGKREGNLPEYGGLARIATALPRELSMQTVILCGGRVTRFREESEFKPKPVIKIGDMPILWHVMKHYSFHGVNDFVLCMGYKADLIRARRSPRFPRLAFSWIGPKPSENRSAATDFRHLGFCREHEMKEAATVYQRTYCPFGQMERASRWNRETPRGGREGSTGSGLDRPAGAASWSSSDVQRLPAFRTWRP
jgi:hypothetical protein